MQGSPKMTTAKYGTNAARQIEYQDYMLNDYINSKERLDSLCYNFQIENSSLSSCDKTFNHVKNKNKMKKTGY